MALYSLTVATSQAQAAVAVPAPTDTLALSDAVLSRESLYVPLQPPIAEADDMDSRWHVEDSTIQPAGVGISVAAGQFTFRLTQLIDDETTVRATTGPTPAQDFIASGPYRLRDSQVLWQNASLPASWGAPGAVVARASLQGDMGDDLSYSIDVTLSDGQITVSHTDASVTTVDYTNDLNATPPTRRAPRAGASAENLFRYLKIQSDSAGADFWVYASTDGQIWLLLVHDTMSADMQGAFVRSTLEFSMTSSGTSAAGAWVVGAINVQPGAAQYPGLYLQSEDQAGFAYNGGVWNQFGAPLDGYRADYTWDSTNARWVDGAGQPHYTWVTGLAYAQDDPNTVYAIVDAHAALFISSDGGLTWTSQVMPFAVRTSQPPGVDASAPLSDLHCFDIASPAAGEILVLGFDYAVTSNPGIHHSTNNGLSWTQVVGFAADPDAAPGFPEVFEAGGMRASSAKVWWSEKVGEDSVTPPIPDLPSPRWRTVWSGALDWRIDMGQVPEDPAGAVLEIPPLDISQITNADGTTTTAAFAYVVTATPGMWQPAFADLDSIGMLWEDGLQDVYHSEEIEGIKGQIGFAAHIQPLLYWQPASIPDSQVDDYWLFVADQAELARLSREWHEAHPFVPGVPREPLPPELVPPAMGGYRGTWIQPTPLGLTTDLLEPMNSRAGARIAFGTVYGSPHAGESISGQARLTDYLGNVTPHMPETSGQVMHRFLRELTPAGGKLHVHLYGDVMQKSSPLGPPGGHSLKMASFTMSGTLSVVVLDIEPADIPLYVGLAQDMRQTNIVPTTGQFRAAGSASWVITSGAEGYYHGDMAVLGPPGHERVVEYQKYEHPTWVYEEIPNPPLLPSTLDIVPLNARDDYAGLGGVVVAAQVAFGPDQLPVPSGWTEIPDTAASSSSYVSVAGGMLTEISPDGNTPGYGVIAMIETGQWSGLFRRYRYFALQYDLRPVTQRLIMRPYSVPNTIELPAFGDPYWIVPVTVGVIWRPVATGGGPPPDEVVSTTWNIKRANFDGTANEVVGTLTFEGSGGSRLQVRPFSDDLALVSSYWAEGVWRVQPGAGATPLWTTTMQSTARPWDAIALDANTFLVASTAVIPPEPSTLRGGERGNKNRGGEVLAR